MFWSLSLTLGESSPGHAHDVAELLLCRGGSGLVVLDGHDIELVDRRAVLIAPRARHRFVMRDGEAARLHVVCVTLADAALHLSPAQAAALRQLGGQGAIAVDYGEDDGWLWALGERIPASLGLADQGELSELWGIIGLFIGRHARVGQGGGAGTSKYGATIRDVCAWLDDHLREPGELDDIASRFGLSRSLLTREFRKHVGMSVVDYLNSRRIQNAGAMLLAGDANIAEAALDSGFSSMTYFYKQFKALYGVTPAELRKQLAGLAAGGPADRG